MHDYVVKIVDLIVDLSSSFLAFCGVRNMHDAWWVRDFWLEAVLNDTLCDTLSWLSQFTLI